MKKFAKHKTALILLSAALTLGAAVTSYAMPWDVGGTQNAIPDDYEGPDAPYDLWWEGSRAEWDEVDGAAKYKVNLYRNGDEIDSVTTSRTHYSFGSRMEKAGTYTFRVRSIDDNGIHGSISDYSDTHHVSGYVTQVHEAQHTEGSNCPYAPSVNQSGWQHDTSNSNWWYRNSDGSYPSNQWQYIDGSWYYFDNNGYMKTGWVTVNNMTYYCLPNGAMATGWQNINGNYYYFDLTMGGLWVSNVTPDGHVVDANGMMVR